jgi:hypothetical protein
MLLVGCDPWDLDPGGYTSLDGATWDSNVATTDHGVYVRLPNAQALVRVQADGSVGRVDLAGATAERMIVTPGGKELLVFASWPECASDDPEIVYVEDCPSEDLSTHRELELVRDGGRVGGTAIEGVTGPFDAASFSPDGRTAALYFDFESGQEVSFEGTVNLNEVVFVDLDAATATSVSVGFAADRVLFSPSGAEAVVLSRSKVAVVAIEDRDGCAAGDVCVTYPLALDPDQVVNPQDVAIVSRDLGDGITENFALVTVTGRSELYVLDLDNESIDIVELAAPPSAIHVAEDGSRSVIVYDSASRVDVLEHDLFEIRSTPLDEPANAILPVPTGELLYSRGARHDVLFFDGATRAVVESRAENPVLELVRAGDKYAVATLSAEAVGGDGASGFYDAHYGISVWALPTAVGEDPGDPIALALNAAPVGFATTTDGDLASAMVLVAGEDALTRVDLASAAASEVDLASTPIGLMAAPQGGFVVTHDEPLGLVSFLDGSGAVLGTAAGFAATDIVSEPTLPRRTPETP